MTTNITYAPQVDYTSRDYIAIRNDLLDLINRYAPTWTSRDPADLGIAMIELFAYMGDSLNFYIDRAANEGFIGTASQRDSVLQLAGMLGYAPNKLAAAKVDLTLTNGNAEEVVIPAGTLFATSAVISGLSTQIVFESDEDVTIPAKSGSVLGTITVPATEGATVSSELIGYSSGSPRQVFKLSYPYVIEDSTSISINNATYTYVPSLIDYGREDFVFTTFNDSSRNTYVVFGDGINGVVPPAAGQIYATYRVGSGANGNVPVNSITHILTNAVASVSVTNLVAATGGADEESTESIRFNAPKALRALTRAVSLKDYASLALQVAGVSKAVADADTLNSVVLYVSPAGDPGVSNGEPTAAFTALADKVAAFFTDKTAPNSSLTILPPTYVPIDVAITVYVLPQYRAASVKAALLTTLRSLVSVNNSFFADTIPVQYLMRAGASVQGIDYITVDVLKKTNNFTVGKWSNSGTTVTLTTTAAHGVTSGQAINVTSTSPNGTIDGIWTVSSVTSTTLVFTNAAASGSGTSTVAVPTQTPTGTVNITMSTTGSHGISVGDSVFVSGVTPSGYNGVWTAQTGTTGSTLVLNIGSNPGAISTAGSAGEVVGVVDPWNGVSTITCAVNEIPSEGNFVLNSVGGIA